MGYWRPVEGTISKALVDRCCGTFGIQDLGYDDRFAKGPCYGDPFGRDCRCHWEAHDLHLELITPQNIDGKVLQFAVPNCSIWTRGGTPWNRKSGVLKVSRVVRASDRHLAWIDPKAIAAGFALAVSDTQVTAAADALQALTNHNR